MGGDGNNNVKYGLRCRCVPPPPPLGGHHHHDAPHCLHRARGDGYEFILADGIFKKEHYEMIMAGEDTDRVTEQFSWCDKQMKSTSDWYRGVVAILNDDAVKELLYSSDPEKSRRAQRVLEEEVDTAGHLCLQAVVLELPEGQKDYLQLAHVLQNAIAKTRMSLWIKLPVAFDHEMEEEGRDRDRERGGKESAWMMWHRFRSFCNFDGKMKLLLEVTLDSVEPESDILLRWLGEPIAGVILPQKCFITSWTGRGVLSPTHEFIVHLFLTATVNLILDPIDCTASGREAMMYMHLCAAKFCKAGPDASVNRYRGTMYGTGYEDFVQNPLQPLQDNLESPTYEVFERDRTKYSLYEEAIYGALMDLVPEEEREQKTVVLMVLGAGRGPIVDSAIQAQKSTGRKVKFFAIEKNRKAANTLFYKNRMDWGENVTVINVDMREWDPEEKADIIVSELLGSFGDNELSPECLDGAQRLLKKGGVMIPVSYTSFIAPVMSPKMFLENARYDPNVHNSEFTYEVPYVVNLYQRYQIAEPKELFSFSHPRQDTSQPNERFGQLTFKPKLDCMLNGFVGYFDCILYKDVRMSILPSTFSRGMFSWYPMFFPIRDAITIKSTDEIQVLFWRRVTPKAVWYEWGLSSPQILSRHNMNGRAYTIGLS